MKTQPTEKSLTEDKQTPEFKKAIQAYKEFYRHLKKCLEEELCLRKNYESTTMG